MPNGLITPGLVLEVAEAGEDLVITTQEFSSIIKTISGIFIGAFTFGAIGLLIVGLAKKF